MAHYLELLVGRTPSTTPWVTKFDGPDFPLTFTKDPRIADLMLFDAASLQVVEEAGPSSGAEPARDLISDREGALKRFKRRLPQVRAALAWDRSACRELEAFGQYFAAIDWPYLRLDTSDFRLVLSTEEAEAFDRELDFALSALDLAAIAKPGRLFGGDGRYSRAWERLLNFCFRPAGYNPNYCAIDAIYNADDTAIESLVCGTPYYFTNDSARLLGAYLPRRDALTVPYIERGKVLLDLTPEQEVRWTSLESALRNVALDCVDRVKPAEPARPLDPESLVRVPEHLVTRAGPLIATLNKKQKRVARRLFQAMGFASAAGKI